MTADSSTAAVTYSGDDDVSAVTSPTNRTTVTPPSPVENQPEGSNDCNGGDVLKSVWNIKPLDSDVVDGVGSAVMGADSWPALSESTRFGAKSSSGSEAVSQAPVISQPPQKQVKPSSNSNNHHNPNNGRQRAMKRGGSVGGGASNRPTGPPSLPPYDGSMSYPTPPLHHSQWVDPMQQQQQAPDQGGSDSGAFGFGECNDLLTSVFGPPQPRYY